MQPKTNQDGGTAGMGMAGIPPVGGLGSNMSAPTDKGMASEVGVSNWRAKNGSTISSVDVLVDGPND